MGKTKKKKEREGSKLVRIQKRRMERGRGGMGREGFGGDYG